MAFMSAFPPSFFNCAAIVMPPGWVPDTMGGPVANQSPESGWSCMKADSNQARAMIEAGLVLGINDIILIGSSDPAVGTDQIVQITTVDGNTLVPPQQFRCFAPAQNCYNQGVLFWVRTEQIQ